MREKLKTHVEGLFADAALTIRNAEIQQEILQHTLDRYDDLIASGKTEQEAYDEAVSGIGDVSGLYAHKQAAQQSVPAAQPRAFPAPPAPDAPRPAADDPDGRRKKRLPGWAIALICVGAALIVLVLNFAGSAVRTLRLGALSIGGYTYDNAGRYQTAARSGFGSEVSASSLPGIRELEIHWLSGAVYLTESDTGTLSFQEDYSGDNDDYRMRYYTDGDTLIIQPCKSRHFGGFDLPDKALTVFLPNDLQDISVTTVSADVELLGGYAEDLSVSTTSGDILGPGLQAQDYTLETVSGEIRLTALPADRSELSCQTVSGNAEITCTGYPDEADFNGVSGNFILRLPEGCLYELDFNTVSGTSTTNRFRPGGSRVCKITAETVSGDVTLATISE